MDYIVLSIPIFFVLIGLELLINRLRHSGWYRFNDAVTNISCGIAQQISGVFTKTIMLVGYVYLFDHFRLFEIRENLWSWLMLFIGIDFFYYWFHRLAHEISFFWGTHIVHHQSEEYNLSVALRQSSFQGFVAMAFYFPLALLGFDPIAFVTISAFQTLYQFWIHTKAIDKLPSWFEFAFNTPSHHRVHHGRNPQYIDRNHDGSLIIFDRMFGTFQAEEEPVVYGVTKPLTSFNPIWANFDWYADLWEDFNRPMRWADRMKLLYKKPGWLPDDLAGSRAVLAVEHATMKKHDTDISISLNYYILLQYLIVLGLTSGFLFNIDFFDRWQQIFSALFILVSISNIGGLFDKKGWAYKLEIVRWLLLLVITLWIIEDLGFLLFSMIVLCFISVAWIFQYRHEFLPADA